jgi:hypothetical protein
VRARGNTRAAGARRPLTGRFGTSGAQVQSQAETVLHTLAAVQRFGPAWAHGERIGSADKSSSLGMQRPAIPLAGCWAASAQPHRAGCEADTPAGGPRATAFRRAGLQARKTASSRLIELRQWRHRRAGIGVGAGLSSPRRQGPRIARRWVRRAGAVVGMAAPARFEAGRCPAALRLVLLGTSDLGRPRDSRAPKLPRYRSHAPLPRPTRRVSAGAKRARPVRRGRRSVLSGP